jgi:hypothetical protein
VIKPTTVIELTALTTGPADDVETASPALRLRDQYLTISELCLTILDQYLTISG